MFRGERPPKHGPSHRGKPNPPTHKPPPAPGTQLPPIAPTFPGPFPRHFPPNPFDFPPIPENKQGPGPYRPGQRPM